MKQHFANAIRPHVQLEIERAEQAELRGGFEAAFKHLERAHVLGQTSTREHVRVHWKMLRWGLRQHGSRRLREVLGQVPRIAGAATKTKIGFVPSGNTGGADVSAFKSFPIPQDLQTLIDEASGSSQGAKY